MIDGGGAAQCVICVLTTKAPRGPPVVGYPRGRRAAGCHIWSFDTNKLVGFINKNCNQTLPVLPVRHVPERGVPYEKKDGKMKQ